MKRHNPSNSQTGPKARSKSRSEARRQLIRQTRLVGRELGAHSTMFNAVIAERLELSLSDLRAWDLLLLRGPLSHGKLAKMIGLSGGAVTALVDRLERAGAVRRHVDPNDRRRMIITVVSSLREGSQRQVFEALGARIDALLDQFSDKELDASCRLMQEVGQIMQHLTAQLRLHKEPAPAQTPVPMKRRRAVGA
jgi:DNA-binding MarR family transcriptional regulator